MKKSTLVSMAPKSGMRHMTTEKSVAVLDKGEKRSTSSSLCTWSLRRLAFRFMNGILQNYPLLMHQSWLKCNLRLAT